VPNYQDLLNKLTQLQTPEISPEGIPSMLVRPEEQIPSESQITPIKESIAKIPEVKPENKKETYTDTLNKYKELTALDKEPESIEKTNQPTINPLIQEYLDKQQEASEGLKNVAILQGANQIAQGFAKRAGGDIGTGEAGIKALKDRYTEQLDSYKNLLKTFNQTKSGKVHFDRVQMPDGKVHTVALSTETGEVVKDLGLAGYALGYRVNPITGAFEPFSRSDIDSFGTNSPLNSQIQSNIPKTQKEKPPVEYSDIQRIAPKKAEDLRKIREDFTKDTGDLRDVASGLSVLTEKLKNPDPNMPIDSGFLGSVQVQMGRSSGLKGAQSDKDLEKFAGTGGVAAALKRVMSNKVFGELTSEDQKFFKLFSEKMAKAGLQDLNNRSKIYKDRVKSEISIPERGLKLNDNDADRLLLTGSVLPMEGILNNNSNSEVKRLDPKTGKTAIFDSNTKKFLRWDE